MKKTLATVVIVVILAFSLVLTAYASTFQQSAEQLNELGLFQGTDAGFDLDRAPNRAEAVIMLVRLLGLEEEAVSGDYSHPFTDVPEWADPHVALAYESGYTTGITPTTFEPRGVCTAQMYVTFVLRALGYSDEYAQGGSLWAEAITFGIDVGVVDDYLLYGNFHRGNMAAVSYIALNAAPADGEFDTLLDKLVADGAVDGAAAAAVLEYFDLFAEFVQIDTGRPDDANFAFTMDMDIDMGILGSTSMEMFMIVEGLDMQAEILMDTVVLGEEVSMDAYILDGFVYINSNDIKVKTDAGLGDVEGMISMPEAVELDSLSSAQLYAINKITKSTQDGLAVFTVELADGFLNSLMTLAMDMMGGMGVDEAGLSEMSLSNGVCTYHVDADGALKKAAISMDMAMVIEIEGVSIDSAASMFIEYLMIDEGDDVSIEFPDDLDEYLLAEG